MQHNPTEADARGQALSRDKKVRDFRLRVAGETILFRFGVDFAEGTERLCWTLLGIEKLIAHGLWTRQFDRRGKLLKKPLSVEALMQKSGAAPK